MITHAGYFYPASLDEALRLLAAHRGVQILAGGSELLPRLRRGAIAPAALLDITRAGLDYIAAQAGSVAVGAATPLHDVQRHPLIISHCAALAEAAGEVGGLQTRHLATIGGNICTGSPSADLAPALLALDAAALLRRQGGERAIPLAEFFLAPQRTALAAGELLAEVRLPAAAPGGSAFVKLGRRRAMRLAIANCAAWVAVEGKAITAVRIAMGSVAPVPLRLPRTEATLTGRTPDDTTLAEAVAVMLAEISPRDSRRATASYRRQVAPVLLKRALATAYGRATGGEG